MVYSNFTFTDHIGVKIFVHKWVPESTVSLKGMVCLVHGMAEHALRYDFFAEALNKEGFVVYCEDHRGHGKSMEEGKAGVLYEDGWNGVVLDLKQLTDLMNKEYPNLPLFIFGNSWGSFLIQDYMQQYPQELKGVILSGTSGKQDALGLLTTIAKPIVKRKGKDSEAGFIYKLGIEPFNKPYKGEGSPNAWISTVKEEVEKYDKDPLCGFKPTNGYFLEMALAMKRIWSTEAEAKISLETPVFMVSGSECAVSNFCKNLYVLINRYKNLGIKDFTYKIYEGARHEVLNESCRDEVVGDCIAFLNSHV